MAARGQGMGQLIKGVVIGVVLILAIIGSMSIFNKDSDGQVASSNINSNAQNNIPAPTISVTQDNSSSSESNIDPRKPISLTPPPTPSEKDSFKPTLENEKTAQEVKEESQKKEPEPVQFGMLRLTSIDYETKNTLKASYVVFDENNKKIVESNDTNDASFRLLAGKYKVISTLSPPSGSKRKTETVQSTRFVTIVGDTVTQTLFKMEPPSTIGILQVSARNAKTNQVMRASFIIQKENGETVADRQSVTNTLFKLNAGSYKVTVRSGENSDFRTVVVEAGESTKEVFMLQESYRQGRVLVRVFDTFSNKPVESDINISTSDGKVVQALKSVSKTEISLPEGNYKIRVTGPYGQSNKNIQVIAGQLVNEVFRFDAPDKEHNNETQVTENVTIKPVTNTPTTDTSIDAKQSNSGSSSDDTSKIDKNTGSIALTAISNNNKLPIKSNFYVQTLSGQHINKKIYSDSATFNLKPGNYKITVRAKGKKNQVRNIQVLAGRQRNETFSLIGVKQSNNVTPPSTTRTTPQLGGVKPAKNTAIRNGFLQLAMKPPRKTHFIVSTQSGKKIVELTSVPNGNFKLDTGIYNVTAILNGQRKSKLIRVNEGKTSRIFFKAANFEKPRPQNNNTQYGTLKSQIIDQAGRPLKGNLIVTNTQGKIVAQANNVSVGIFKLPSTAHIVTVNYRGLRGSERIKIIRGETTMQTFTIAQNRNQPQGQQPHQNDNKSTKDILRDRLEQEIRKRF